MVHRLELAASAPNVLLLLLCAVFTVVRCDEVPVEGKRTTVGEVGISIAAVLLCTFLVNIVAIIVYRRRSGKDEAS